MPRRVAPAGLLALVTVLGLGPGLTACDDPDPSDSAPSAPTSTPLADFATDGLAVTRAEFCSRVAPDAVEKALGAPATGSDSYANGDRVRLAPGVTDVAHEFGCSWTAEDGTKARAWVFAPPVTPQRARVLRATAADRQGCTPVTDAPAFGSPSVAVRCGDTTTFQGLFGDAWLTCSLESADLVRTGRWCVSVVQASR